VCSSVILFKNIFHCEASSSSTHVILLGKSNEWLPFSDPLPHPISCSLQLPCHSHPGHLISDAKLPSSCVGPVEQLTHKTIDSLYDNAVFADDSRHHGIITLANGVARPFVLATRASLHMTFEKQYCKDIFDSVHTSSRIPGQFIFVHRRISCIALSYIKQLHWHEMHAVAGCVSLAFFHISRAALPEFSDIRIALPRIGRFGTSLHFSFFCEVEREREREQKNTLPSLLSHATSLSPTVTG
jgi:hypothetical protein